MQKVYISFKDITTQEEKLKIILDHLHEITSKDMITKLVVDGYLEIISGRKYKELCGCPVVYLGKIVEKTNSKASGRKCFREINRKFPLYGLSQDLLRLVNVENLQNNEDIH